MNKILDENYYDLIVSNRRGTLENNDTFTALNDRHCILHAEVPGMDLCDLGLYPYYRFPTLYTLASELSISRSGITRIQSNPLLSLYGRGVIVGIIDTGIDYRHSAFRFSDNTTRILSIWDQTVQTESPPEGFTFGSEYSREIINFALESGDPLSIVPTNDENGHGTAIASIIAGRSDASQSFSGVVPEAQLIVVKLKEAKQNLKKIFCVNEDALCYQETDIILGIRYIFSSARRLGRPLVICLAISSSMTGHEALGATSSYINYLCQLPQVNITVAAGNEGNRRGHYYCNVSTPPYSKEFELRISRKDSSFAFEIWPDLRARLTVQVTAPNGETMPIVYPSFKGCSAYDFILSTTYVWVNNILIEEENGTQLILIRLRNASEGIWRVRVVNIDSNPFSFHSWLPGGGLISEDTFFIESTPDTTITSPGNAYYALTISAYNQFTDSILITSGRGYTRFGLVKPNIAAPGYEIPCASPNNGYVSLTGTGAAAAHASGAVAVLFEWAIIQGNFTSITGNDVNTLIMRGAARSTADVYPDNIWGYGKLDLYSLFLLLTLV
ncbi:S8 family peptidase [Lactonifactor longoviformis]|uniref:S8 family peptidase n=1 Tax=Lactonifactor longoviformis TaxID=341220 RepID=UPI0036F3BA98